MIHHTKQRSPCARQASWLLSLLILARLAGAAEPDLATAAAEWPPTLYATTVLAPLAGAAKFNTFNRGGVQTLYTSEVVGHSPLTPERAKHSHYFDQGLMAGFATGPRHDYREGPIVHEQQLLDGHLPLMITRWQDAAGELPFRYEETTFVSHLVDALPTERGDENAAAHLQLAIHNPARQDRVAQVRLVVNASGNSQPRGYPAGLYRAALRTAGNRATNAAGQTRLVWRASPAVKVTPALQAQVPTIMEFGPETPRGVERPAAAHEPFFTRYCDTRTLENHQAHKAFDQLAMSYWSPETMLAEGPVGLGLVFPGKRQLRSVIVGWDPSGGMPPANGYRLEGYDGLRWTPIAHQINGKPADELKNHPEIVTELGQNWLLVFDKPVEVQGFRLLVDKLLNQGHRPSIAALDYSSTIGSDPATGEPIWTDTQRDTVANHVDFAVPIAAGATERITVSIPFRPASEIESQWLDRFDFQREKERVAAHWRDYLAQGAKLELPEKYPQQVFAANVSHMLTTAERQGDTGHFITLTSLGWYEGVWASLSAVQATALDERGYHDAAARILEPFLDWQGTMQAPGEFRPAAGFLASNDSYTWVRWASNHGFLLAAMADHFRLSGDRAWLDRVLPKLLLAAQWIETQRTSTRVRNAQGLRPSHWGLLPPGSTGDGAPNCYGFMGDAVTWRGLDALAAVLKEIEHPEAKRFCGAAEEYRKCILSGVEFARLRTPQYQLKSGESIPFIANDVYNVWKINTGLKDPNVNFHIWWMDVGPLHLVDQGVLDPKSALTGHLLAAAQDRWMKGNVSTAEPYYNPQRTAYLGRDQIDDFLRMYYTLLVEGMDRQTFVTGEYHHGQQNLPFCDAEQSRTQRMMLVRENGPGVDFATATPRAWLRHGQRIAFLDARTHFGKTSLEITSQADQGTITANITPPDRQEVPLRLRLRHPSGAKIASVTINGQPAEEWQIDGDWIELLPGQVKLNIVARY